MNSMLNLSDALEINQAAAEFFASIYPQFKYLTVLEHETESLRIITEAGYLNDVHGCMSQLRYRKQLQDAYRRKVGIDPLPGRCGTSCSKCASEIVMLEAQGLLPKGHQAALELSATYLRAIASREHPDVDPKEIISATLGPLGEVYEP
jgi:hypothetical protein